MSNSGNKGEKMSEVLDEIKEDLPSMSEAQRLAYEIYLESPSITNDWTPITEKALQAKLKEKGFSVGAGSINRWKKKFKWAEALEAKLALAIASDDNKELIKNSALKTATKNTQVSIELNNELVATGYDIAYNEFAILKAKSDAGALDMKDFKKFSELMKIFTDREDRMLDRLAQIPRINISAEQILGKLEVIDIEVEE